MAIASILKKVFGSKADRDLKQIRPILNKVLEAYGPIDKLTNDELRAKTEELKARLRDCEAPFEKRIAEIKAKMEEDIPVHEKESLATESDKLVKDEDAEIERVLDEVLPEAFAIMKSTARRFKENATIEVTANDFDRALSVNHDFVHIEGDKAVYQNHWVAGGNEVTWDMVHYDVQLIGGIVLHQGKIAEMATGEGKTLVATLPVFLNALAGKGVHVVTVNDYLSKRDSEWMGPLYMFHGLSVDCIDKHEPNSDARKRAYNCSITFGTNNEFGFDYLRDNMAVNMTDLVQVKHHYAIVDEVDSVLIDDARTPLIISGPVAKAQDDEQYMEYRPYVESLYQKQRALVTQVLNDAKRAIAAGKEDEGGMLLLRAYKGLPKYQPLIKFLSEQGMKQLLQKAENYYMQDNEREMHIVTDELYFVISEQQHSVDMTDKGHDLLANAVSNPDFFVLPDVGSQIAEIQKNPELSAEEKQEKKDALMEDYSLKSERVHTVIQLLKAYAMFQKDVDYIVIDNKVKIVDEQTGRIMEGRRWSDGLHQAVEAKENVKVEAATQTFATVTLQNYFRMYHKLAGMTGTAKTEEQEFQKIYNLPVVVVPTNKPMIRIDYPDVIYKTRIAKYKAAVNEIEECHKSGRPVLVGTTSIAQSEELSAMLKRRNIPHNVLNAKYHEKEAEIISHAGQYGAVTIATNMAGRGTDITLGEGVPELGGLHIIGTERHESRRIDNQLRGRCARQGDPGSSKFFLSLEDDLMRLFGSDNIAGIMDKLGMEDDEPIEHSLVTKSIENAQKKVEARNFSIRKHVLEYDDVMNQQREVIYSQRHKILHQENLKDTIKEMVDETVERTMTMYAPPEVYSEDWDLQALINYAEDFYAPRGLLTVDYLQNLSREELAEYLQKVADDNYQAREDAIGPELMRELENLVMLKVVDNHWMEHLDAMDMLREGVGLRAYGQKDPLVEYKFEAYDMFEAMMEAIKEDVVRYIYRVNVITQPQVEDPLENASTNNPTPEGDEGNLKAEPKK